MLKCYIYTCIQINKSWNKETRKLNKDPQQKFDFFPPVLWILHVIRPDWYQAVLQSSQKNKIITRNSKQPRAGIRSARGDSPALTPTWCSKNWDPTAASPHKLCCGVSLINLKLILYVYINTLWFDFTCTWGRWTFLKREVPLQS